MTDSGRKKGPGWILLMLNKSSQSGRGYRALFCFDRLNIGLMHLLLQGVGG